MNRRIESPIGLPDGLLNQLLDESSVDSLQQPPSRVASHHTAGLTSNQQLRIYYEWVGPVFTKGC